MPPSPGSGERLTFEEGKKIIDALAPRQTRLTAELTRRATLIEEAQRKVKQLLSEAQVEFQTDDLTKLAAIQDERLLGNGTDVAKYCHDLAACEEQVAATAKIFQSEQRPTGTAPR